MLAKEVRAMSGDQNVRQARRAARRYDPLAVEPKWQRVWEETGLYHVDLDTAARERAYNVAVSGKMNSARSPAAASASMEYKDA